MNEISQTLPPSTSEKSPYRYTAGTLKYNTLLQLLLVCGTLMLARHMMGITCYALVPTIKPILLDRVGADARTIAVIIGTIPSFLNFILCPIISTVSDRTRTRFGRRSPYLLWSAPVLALLLVLIGFSPKIAEIFALWFPSVHCNWGLWVLAVLIVLFQIAFLFPGSVEYYLEAEVIPKECLGQYYAVVSITNAIIGAGFSYFLVKPAVEHMTLSMSIFAVLYLGCYVLQFFVVKEGEFPPAEKVVEDDRPWAVKTWEYCLMFFRQCFTSKIYVYLALCTGLNAASNICRSMFNILFATKDLQIDIGTYGKIGGISGIVSAVLIYFFGRLMDKTHPMLIYFLGGLMVMATNVFGYFLVWDTKTYFVIAIVTTLVYAFQNLANTPLLVRLLPMDKFGQYASGNAMVNHISLMIGAALGGWFTERFGYRVMFVWDFVVTGLATLALIGVYFEWKRYGGKNYQAPIVH